MIWEWLFGKGMQAVVWLAGVIADIVPDPPAWLATGLTGIQMVASFAGLISTWVPWEIVVGSIAYIVVVWWAVLTIRWAQIALQMFGIGK